MAVCLSFKWYRLKLQLCCTLSIFTLGGFVYLGYFISFFFFVRFNIAWSGVRGIIQSKAEKLKHIILFLFLKDIIQCSLQQCVWM